MRHGAGSGELQIESICEKDSPRGTDHRRAHAQGRFAPSLFVTNLKHSHKSLENTPLFSYVALFVVPFWLLEGIREDFFRDRDPSPFRADLEMMQTVKSPSNAPHIAFSVKVSRRAVLNRFRRSLRLSALKGFPSFSDKVHDIP
jgi:hypothetical protein